MALQAAQSTTGVADTPATVTYRPVMSRSDMIAFAALLFFAVLLTLRYAAWWFDPDNLPTNYAGSSIWLIALGNFVPFLALSMLEGLRILQMASMWLFAAVMRSAIPLPAPHGLRVAVLTTIVPSKEPLSMLEQTLKAMKLIRSPDPIDIWVLDEEDSPEVQYLCSRLGVNHFTRHGIAGYNQTPGKGQRRTPFRARTKSGNHNAWRDQHGEDYDVVAQMDPDHVPSEDFLEKTLGFFRDPDVAYVVAPQVYYRNTDSSWIARGADEQNFGFSAITQRGANFLGIPIFIGSNHLARSRALDSVRGYASHIVEDHLTGMLLLTTENPATGNRWKGVYTEEIVSYGEGPARWSSYLSQQLRWAYGLIEIVRHNSGRLLRRMRFGQLVGFSLIQSYYPSVALIIVTGLALTAAHLFFGVNAIHVSFKVWLGHWFPQFAVSIAIAYWLQRFYLREADRGWGLRGILVGIGATVTYVQAMTTAILGYGLSYIITPKGEVGTREPIRLFRWHVISMFVSIAGLAWALSHSSGAPTIMFWAVLNIVLMVLVIATGVLVPQVLRSRVSCPWFDSVSKHVRVAIPLAAGIIVLLLVTQVLDRGESPSGGLVSVEPTAMPVGAPVGATEPTGVPGGAATEPTPVHTPAPLDPVHASFLEAGTGAVAFGDFELESALDIASKIRHEFIDFEGSSIERMEAAVEQAVEKDQVTLLSWGPKFDGRPADSTALLEEIAAGDFDEYIAEAAAVLRDFRQPVILRFAHEMDHGTDELHPWAGHPPEVFITAWRRVHGIFQEQGATNVLFAWTPGGYFINGLFTSDYWYPGDDVVDFVGFSVYAFWRWEEWDAERAQSHAFRSPEELILPRYLALAAHGKPVIIPELGIDLYASQDELQIGWLIDLVDFIDRDLPQLVAIVYFHAPHTFPDFDIDWRLTPAEQRAFGERLSSSGRIELATD